MIDLGQKDNIKLTLYEKSREGLTVIQQILIKHSLRILPAQSNTQLKQTSH